MNFLLFSALLLYHIFQKLHQLTRSFDNLKSFF
ncbi:MAG: histidine kinase [Streptococcus gallolyticus]|nr:histidine kinase [Streptococcus gallolyticus]